MASKKVLRNKKVEQKVRPALAEPSASSFDRVRHLGAVGSKNFVRLIKTETSDGRRVSYGGGGEGRHSGCPLELMKASGVISAVNFNDCVF